MAPVWSDYRQRNSNLRSKILKNEEQRLQLEQKLRSMSTNTPHSHQKRQIQHIQTYFTRLNEQSQRAEQRNLKLLQELTQAQEHLDKLHFDAEHLSQLKNDYLHYLETHYPNWQRPTSSSSTPHVNNSQEYDRLNQQIQLENDGNLRQVQQSYDVNSSMLFKRYEDQLNVGLDQTLSPPIPVEQSISESIISRSKHTGSLRMELHRRGLNFLLDYIENELKDTIDKKKFYRLDPPTITQKRTILDIANEQQIYALKDHDPTTISMVILDQLPSTIRRTTVNKCLLTEEILSSNIKDLDKNLIAQMLPEQDQILWLRLIDHFVQLLKFHCMNIQTVVNKFTLALLPANSFYTHDKAKSLLKHILEKLVGRQISSSDDDTSSSKIQPIEHIIHTNPTWMKKLTQDDDDEKSTSSSSTIKRSNIQKDDSDQDYFI